MSRWWREHWQVAFAPWGVHVAIRPAGLRSKSSSLDEPSAGNEFELPDWQHTASTLSRLVERSGRARRLDLGIELSDAFVRYALVPWTDALRSEREVHAYACHRVREIYGPAAQAWVVRVSAGAPGEARIAACIDQGLMDALHAIAAAFELRLASVVPRFTADLDRRRRDFAGDGAFWFASHESGRVVAAACEGGGWLSIANVRDEGDPAHALLSLLAREALALDEALPRTVVLDGFDPVVAATLSAAGWHVAGAAPVREIAGVEA